MQEPNEDSSACVIKQEPDDDSNTHVVRLEISERYRSCIIEKGFNTRNVLGQMDKEMGQLLQKTDSDLENSCLNESFETNEESLASPNKVEECPVKEEKLEVEMPEPLVTIEEFPMDGCGSFSLTDHLGKEQDSKPNYLCEKSQKDSAVKADRSREKTFGCEICGKLFSQASYLKKHLRVHSGEQPFRCELCGKAFSFSSNLNTHLRVHNGEKPFGCDVCGKFFAESSSLKKHLRIHNGEKPFGCKVCGKFFSESSSVKKHLRIHSGEKPFKCTVCGKSFTESGSLKVHFRIHNGEKPYKCEKCGKTFVQSCNFKRHLCSFSGEKTRNGK